MTTTSPNTTQQKAEDQMLLSDRAASIGWFFIESYYDFYNNNIENIHKIYRADASISHNKFPMDVKEPKTIYKASGTKAIKTRFANESSLKYTNRIVVTSANFEVCLNDKILIVVCGEWSKNGSSYWQFTQTFLLTPGKKENSFDVANDILVYIDLEETKDEPIIVTEEENTTENKSNGSVPKEAETMKSSTEPKDKKPEEIKVPKTAAINPIAKDVEDVVEKKDVAQESKSKKKVEPVVAEKIEVNAQEKKPVKTEREPEPEVISEKEKVEQEKPEQPQVDSHTSAADATVTTEETDKKDKEIKKEKVVTPEPSELETENTSKSGTPLSWAALASQAAPLKHSNKPSISSPSQVITPPSSKASSQQPQSQPPSLSSQTPQQQQQNIKYKKEDWFPIYIRGVKQLDEKQLKDHLTKKFGGIKFFKPNGNIALCDFFSEDSQKKALEAKETTVDNITIQLEHRESKASNNGGKKVKDQKEKINGDSKRGRNDKKQSGKKNKSTSS